MFKCVVFDVDGTLVDTGEAIIASLQKVLREDLGQEYEPAELAFAFGIPGAVTLSRLGVKNIDASLDKWLKYMSEFSDTVKVFEGIADCLSLIRERNVKLGIVTSKTWNEFNCDFVPLGLREYFDYVVCADDTQKHKPYPEPLLKLLQLSGLKPEDIIYIGDTKYDMECAKGAGVSFGLALWGAKSTEGFEAYCVLNKPCDILDFI